jgi:hypothetical protein
MIVDDDATNIKINQHSSQYKFLGQRTYTGKSYLDEYATPKEAVYSLINFFAELNVHNDTNIWECCCGSLNAIGDVLTEKGFRKLYFSDIQGMRTFLN